MRFSALAKFVIVVLVALLVHAPAAYPCTLVAGAGPPLSEALVYDYHFDEACPYWIETDYAYIDGDAAVFSAFGSVYQEVVVDTAYSSYGLSLDVTITSDYPGTERLRVEIVNTSGTVLETVDVFSGNDASGRYDFTIGDYDNQTIRLRLRRPPVGLHGGDTVFSVNWICIWGRF